MLQPHNPNSSFGTGIKLLCQTSLFTIPIYKWYYDRQDVWGHDENTHNGTV